MNERNFFTPTSSGQESDDPNDDKEPDRYVSEVKVKPAPSVEPTERTFVTAHFPK